MEITPIGYIVIPLGILLLITKKNWLFNAFIFFTPFTASAVININSITFGLQIPYYFAILWIIRNSFPVLYTNNLKLSKYVLKLLIPLLLFWIIALISLLMPIILDNKVLVHYPDDPWIFSPLKFKRVHITQFLYLTFVISVAMFLSFEVNTKEKLYKAIRILLISGTFVCIWGIFQFVGYYVGIPYPYWLFNNNISFSQGYGQTVLGIFKRISSVAPEPSKFAIYLLWILPFFLALRIKNDYLIVRKRLSLYVLLLFIVLLFSTSTTSYLGVVFMTFVLLFYFFDIKAFILRKTIKKSFLRTLMVSGFVLCFILTIMLFLVFILNINTSDIVKAAKFITVEKMQTLSGKERSEGFIKGFEIFFRFPIFGIGWGSNRSFDLVTTLLSTTGILGFTAFMFFIIRIILKLNSLSKSYLNLSDKNLALAFMLSILTGLFAHFIADPDIISLTMWVIIGLSISFINITQTKKVKHANEKSSY